MKIGIITVNDKPTTALASGGTEVFVTEFAKALKRKGHEVILFATGDSFVEGVDIIPSTSTALDKIQSSIEEKKGEYLSYIEREFISNMLCLRNVVEAKKKEQEIDIFHDNTGSPIVAAVLDVLDRPVVNTLHMPITDMLKFDETVCYIKHNNTHFVTISEYQKNQLPTASKLIYNGISITPYLKSDDIQWKDDRIVWIGRIDPSTPKGLDEAIITAKSCGVELEYVGFVENGAYYDEKIKPLLSKNIKKLEQFKSIAEKVSFYKRAKLTLLPIQWEEPFGLTFIESMAAGTPVVTYARGAAPEIIKDGVTGFLVNAEENDQRGDWIIKESGIEGLKQAVKRIQNMNQKEYRNMRENCIQHVKEHFTLERMTDEYLNYFEQILYEQQES